MFTYEIEVEKPLAEVYAAFNDQDNMPRWITGLQRTELISGEPGKPGAKTRQVYLERGRTIELIETIREHVPGERFVGTIEGEGMSCDLQVEFVDKGASTVVRMRSKFQPQKLAMRFMLPLFKGQIRKRQEGDLKRFGELVEAGELGGATG